MKIIFAKIGCKWLQKNSRLPNSILMYYSKLLFIFLILGLFHSSYAQLASGNYCFEKFKEYRLSDLDSALYFARLTIINAEHSKDSLLLVKGNNAAGYTLTQKGMFEEAIKHYEIALRIAEENQWTDQEIYMTNNLGMAFQKKGDYDKSLNSHLKSLRLREAIGDEALIKTSKNNIGLVYYKLHQYDNALKYFNESLGTSITQHEFATYNNIGLCYIGKNEFEEALKNFDYVVKNCKNCSPKTLGESYSGLGIAFYKMGIESMAIRNFEISEEYVAESTDKILSVVNNHYLAEIAFNKRDFTTAHAYLNTSITIANDLNSTLWLKNNFSLASKVEESTGNFEKALSYHQSYMSLHDSLLNEQVIENIQSLQQDYNDSKYQEYLASMDLRIAQQNKLNTALICMVFLISIVGLVLYNSNKNRKRATRLISKAYMEVERQKERLENAVKTRTLELNKSNQDLNNFIYKTSHDIRGPLATLKGICNIALMDVTDPVAVKYFEKLEVTSERLIDIVGRIQHINHIKNYKLESTVFNLNKLTHEVIESIDDNVKGETFYNVAIPENQLLKADANLIRIALVNIIHNAFKFSRKHSYEPSFVSITFTHSNDLLKISVIDNGYGIEQGEMNKIFDLFYKNDIMLGGQSSAGIGLHLAEMAVKKLDGRIEVESIPMVKTTFNVCLPAREYIALDM